MGRDCHRGSLARRDLILAQIGPQGLVGWWVVSAGVLERESACEVRSARLKGLDVGGHRTNTAGWWLYQMGRYEVCKQTA